MRQPALFMMFAMGGANAATYNNYNKIPAYSELTTCTDTDYHTDCAWNECCGYFTSCCE